jgi:hypothetical protein
MYYHTKVFEKNSPQILFISNKNFQTNATQHQVPV